MKPLAVITHWVHPEVKTYLEPYFDVVASPERETQSEERLLSLAKHAAALMVFMPDSIDDAFLSRCPELKVVSAALKGYDNFDVESCTKRGIWFTIVPDLLTEPTAELAVGLMIGIGRKILPGDAFVRSGRFRGWRPHFYSTGLTGRKVGILGMGAVGQAVARRLSGFSVEISYFDTVRLSEAQERDLSARCVSWDVLLGTNDYLVSCLPLNSRTLGIIDESALSAMKEGACLVNVGRGSVVSEKAVADALTSGKLAGYAADVFESEDWMRPDRPREIAKDLLDLQDKTLFTPHIGSAVDDVRLQIAQEAARNMVQAIRGERPDGAINDVPWVGRQIGNTDPLTGM